MALSMIIIKPNLPSVIKTQPNGAVDPSLLAIVDKPGLTWEMAELPARGMRALHAAATTAGIDLRSTGRGRTLAQQWQIFGGSSARYMSVDLFDYSAAPLANRKFWPFADYTSGAGLPAPGRASVASLLNVTIPNTSYWIKIETSPGHYPSTAAVPGTSNHGFWCADDLQEYVGGIGLPSIRSSTLQWLYGNAQRFGFAWELASEIWHIHWINGDVVPQAVLDYENPPDPPTPVPVPEPTPPPVSSGLMITIFELTDAAAVFYGYTFNGVALQVEWTGDGADPAVQDRLRILKQFGANTIKVSAADIGRTTLLGSLPTNDPLKTWTSADFAKHIPEA